MVVVKYLFQFGFFPWNSYAMLVRNEGKPFFPPRILGLEKSSCYIKYDLAQLLALFFHRSLLLVSPGAAAAPGVVGALESTQWVLGGSAVVPTQGTCCWLGSWGAMGWGVRCVVWGASGTGWTPEVFVH